MFNKEAAMKIEFSSDSDWYITRLGNTEVRVSYNTQIWHLEWIEYEITNQCNAEYWCSNHNCHIEDLDNNADYVAEDFYCITCPKKLIDAQISNSYSNCDWSKNPATIEEARQCILEKYENIEHNGLIKSNRDFCRIMYGTWVLSSKAVPSPKT